MTVRKNKNNKTVFVTNTTPSGLGLHYSVPTEGVKKAQRLTINQGGRRIDLSGSQINSLLRVVRRARNLASRS